MEALNQKTARRAAASWQVKDSLSFRGGVRDAGALESRPGGNSQTNRVAQHANAAKQLPLQPDRIHAPHAARASEHKGKNRRHSGTERPRRAETESRPGGNSQTNRVAQHANAAKQSPLPPDRIHAPRATRASGHKGKTGVIPERSAHGAQRRNPGGQTKTRPG